MAPGICLALIISELEDNEADGTDIAQKMIQ
jgi:hypothetical protein